MQRVQPAALSIEAAITRLDEIAPRKLASTGAWSPAQVFAHLAQSVEYSMGGFPQHRSAAFKLTAGRLAFRVFARRGAMSHPLDDAIPGAPPLEDEDDPRFSLMRLRQSLVAFGAHEDPCQPHFAYGHLDHRQYTAAHVMHLNDHLSEILIDDSDAAD